VAESKKAIDRDVAIREPHRYILLVDGFSVCAIRCQRKARCVIGAGYWQGIEGP
jgi:hypothetical protein